MFIWLVCCIIICLLMCLILFCVLLGMFIVVVSVGGLLIVRIEYGGDRILVLIVSELGILII